MESDQHLQLRLDLKSAQEHLRVQQDHYKSIRKQLSKTEDAIVEAKEGLRKAEESLETYQNTQVVSVVDEDLRDAEIERLKTVLPEMMERIKNEAPIMILDLTMDEPDDEDGED